MSTLAFMANVITLGAIIVNFVLQAKMNAAQHGVNMAQNDINHLVHARLLELEAAPPGEEVRPHVH